jgi:hypothetical protein
MPLPWIDFLLQFLTPLPSIDFREIRGLPYNRLRHMYKV